ncbi:hypothetical protein BV25DRAFT_379753 [Artomyces pyxidatus]|uniref:Uncharacterized protein n=1 Tax=Artomyces pyxidatus TaxID=48021 RepID=A0ACB8T484_9AGAM|nr:hypothetical protein BV25DRAFT_379753 [Artomyces pyxidatus]
MEMHEQVQNIDAEIVRHSQILCKLKERRNSFTTISSLLPDVLCYIFRLVVLESDRHDSQVWDNSANHRVWFNSDLRTRYNAARRAIDLSHVCRHWRNVARSDAVLWTQPMMTSEKWCWRMLSRSKEAELTIRVLLPSGMKLNHNIYRSTLRSLNRLSRIQRLLVSNGVSGPESDALLALLIQPAPVLRSLTLISSSVPAPWTRRDVLHENIFGGVVPSLRHLAISAFDVPWSCHLLKLSHLTHLELSSIVGWRSATLGHLLEVLQAMPRLVTLSLRDAIPSGQDDGGRRATLPELMNLTIFDGFDECVSVLEHIDDIPGAATVRLSPHAINDTTGGTSAAMHRLFALVAPFCTGCRTMHFMGRRHATSMFMRIECWPDVLTERTAFLPQHPATNKTSCALRSTAVQDALPDVVRDIATTFALTDVQTLSYECVEREDYHLALMRQTLELFEHTQTFRATAQSFAVLMNLGVADTDPPTILPHLATLVLDFVNVTTTLFRKLLSFLAKRSGTIRAVKIYESHIRPSYVRELETVIEVLWDKKEPGIIPRDILLQGDDVDDPIVEPTPTTGWSETGSTDALSPFEPAEDADEL